MPLPAAWRPGWRACLIAARFLTRAPLPDPGPLAATEPGRAALCYPWIGLLLGLLLATLALALGGLATGPATPALAALLLGLWVWGTGALHLDGLADCADAWVGGLESRERTFQILADPHVGAMGVVALVLALLIKLAALLALFGSAPTTRPPVALVLIWVPALARAQLLLLALTTPAARATGMGAALRQTLPRQRAWWTLALLWGLALALLGAAGLLAGALALTVLLTWRRSMLVRLGGFTGDTAGALVELTELALLLGLALAIAGG
ncbi:MAG: adenosylcobinamide-GDP ribazoletransferase [Chromatiaceae bacterium]|nr:MAG: adenosylcobinamide-GDP ribazoletransferase [Chromatiaceae bacterium]